MSLSSLHRLLETLKMQEYFWDHMKSKVFADVPELLLFAELLLFFLGFDLFFLEFEPTANNIQQMSKKPRSKVSINKTRPVGDRNRP